MLIVVVGVSVRLLFASTAISQEVTCKPIGEFSRIAESAGLVPQDLEVDSFVRAPQARVQFGVDGTRLAAVVIDSGVNFHHQALADRVIHTPTGQIVGRDFTSTAGSPDELLDTYGHGSGIAGIILSKAVPSLGITKGIAPGAHLIPIKVYKNRQGSNVPVTRVSDALQWVADHHEIIERQHDVQIGVVNLSLGFAQNAQHFGNLQITQYNRAKDLIQQLREDRIVVVVASGNSFHDYEFEQGMDFPAICDPAVSVGAVYDVSIDFETKLFYQGECWVKHAVRNRVAPFSQRLSQDRGFSANTTILAPGHNVSSVCGWDPVDPEGSSRGVSANNGTSRAAPVAAGAILLLQQRYLMRRGRLPTVSRIEAALYEGGEEIVDSEEVPAGTYDSVTSTGDRFRRLDVFNSLEEIDKILHDEEQRLAIAAESGVAEIPQIE